ncbi:MAG: hypothetical protein LQ342_000474 [Letrouitia transgressa]|nr:MAG: hypothetical protein LQ342_000474 [Letrouitia transgressa]
MCLPYPSLKGGIEVEERYPRTNDPREPRRKRLHFVRDPSDSPRSSDEWALMRSSFHTTRPRRDHEMREHEMREQIHMLNDRQRQLALENQHQRQLLQHQQQVMHHPPPPPAPIGWDQHHGGGGGGGHPPAVRMLPQPRYGDDDEVVEEWNGPPPQVVEVKPRAAMPRHVRSVRHGHGHGRGRSRSRHRRDHSGGSIYSDSLRGHRSHYSSNDSFEDLGYPPRRRRW